MKVFHRGLQIIHEADKLISDFISRNGHSPTHIEMSKEDFDYLSKYCKVALWVEEEDVSKCFISGAKIVIKE